MNHGFLVSAALAPVCIDAHGCSCADRYNSITNDTAQDTQGRWGRRQEPNRGIIRSFVTPGPMANGAFVKIPNWISILYRKFLFKARQVAMMIAAPLLVAMLSTLSVQEMREVYGLTKLELPWVAVELTIHAMVLRRMMDFEVPLGVQCLELFAGTEQSSQVAKAFAELGCVALAFDVLRNLELFKHCFFPFEMGNTNEYI